MPIKNNLQGLPPQRLYSASLDLVSARNFTPGVDPDIKIKCNTLIITQCDINGVHLAFNEEMFANPIVINVVPYQKLLVIRANIEGVYVQNTAGGAGKALKYVYGNDIDLFANPNTSSISLDEVGGTAITLGQKAMAASIPVAVASDQSAVPISNANLDAAISTRATEATLALIKAKTDNLDAASSTLAKEAGGNLAAIAAKDFATQTTLALVKANTDNIDVALSTLATQATANGIKTQTDKLSFDADNSLVTTPKTQVGSQDSADNATNQKTLTTRGQKAVGIYVQRNDASNLAGNLIVEVSNDNAIFYAVDTVALAAAQFDLKEYSDESKAATKAVNPMNFAYVRLTVDAQGAGHTSKLQWSAK